MYSRIARRDALLILMWFMQADDTEYLDKFTTCCRQALKFNKVSFAPFPISVARHKDVF